MGGHALIPRPEHGRSRVRPPRQSRKDRQCWRIVACRKLRMSGYAPAPRDRNGRSRVRSPRRARRQIALAETRSRPCPRMSHSQQMLCQEFGTALKRSAQVDVGSREGDWDIPSLIRSSSRRRNSAYVRLVKILLQGEWPGSFMADQHRVSSRFEGSQPRLIVQPRGQGEDCAVLLDRVASRHERANAGN